MMDRMAIEEWQRQQLWGPAAHKLSWTQMCTKLSEANPSWAKEISDKAPLFMSEQIHRLKLGKNRGGGYISHDRGTEGKDILLELRPEDAIHIPQVRFDCNSEGKIMEWNRSMCDLTGISPSQVVGKLYSEVLEEWLPNLSKEYKEAAVQWVKTNKGDNNTAAHDVEDCRKESDHLLDLYPQLTGYPGVPQCLQRPLEEARSIGRLYKWNFDTSGWFGGLEFTLRRKAYIPSLQKLCRDLLPKGVDHAVNEDGSLAVTKPAPDEVEDKPQTSEEDQYTAIAKYILTCGPLGMTYIREVMAVVHKKCRNWGQRTKNFHFSADWSTNPETATIHKSVVLALGGTQLIQEKVEKGKLVWTLDYESRAKEFGERMGFIVRVSGGNHIEMQERERMNKKELERLKGMEHQKVDSLWNDFWDMMAPVIAENKKVPVACDASDSPFILPAVNRAEHTVLTLKIEGHERSDGSYGEEKFKANAVVQVPASLNFFQLHRVVCLAMNCSNCGRRETHEWRVPNVNSDVERPITDRDVDYVQLGETYFVQNGKRGGMQRWGDHFYFDRDNKEGKDILLELRPEDAIHIPQVCFDCNSEGRIMEWNRSMCDLTGISPSQVVGKLYSEVLEEWLPNLTKEYKEAAVQWVKSNKGDNNTADENSREEYLFPLPLPIKYDMPFKYASGNRPYCEYVELLVARSDHLLDLYSELTGYPGVPQCIMDPDGGARFYKWNFDTSGWFGGLEFTLRRIECIPSLQALCRGLLPKGVDHAVDKDGSLVATKPAPSGKVGENDSKDGPQQTPKEAAYSAISNYVRTCGPMGMRYIREVMKAVHKKCRNYGQRTKNFHFTADWSTNPETSAIHKIVVHEVLGGELIKENVDKGKLVWTLDFERGGEGMVKGKQLQLLKEQQASRIDRLWGDFRDAIAPVIAENKHVPVTCGASDSTFILPATERPERTVLTLKIEGHERTEGSDLEEKFKANAVVQVPASLNFFQLHRVVCLTMNCCNHGTRETHEWRVPNINSHSEKHVTDPNVEYVQLGETYHFVEDGKRGSWTGEGLFGTCGAIRQRVSRTGAFIDQEMPLYSFSLKYDDMIRMRRKNSGCHFERMKACIHSTCISAVFFQPGTTALLQDGLVKYFASYKITCMKSEEYDGPLPLSPDINVMQPKCLRGKPEDGNSSWSVKSANRLLRLDRGCLRRNLRKVGSDDYMVQMPFCKIDPVHGPYNRDRPVAVELTGLDHHPLFLHGEPPLPSSEGYKDYVSSLRGRIDPKFLQENIVNMYGHFAVPFNYGSTEARGTFVQWTCYDPDDVDDPDDKDSSGSTRNPGIGHVWAREVDEEMKRIDSLKPKKAGRGKKRKAPSKASAS